MEMKGWQQEYLAELKRTTGRTESFIYNGGGWYCLTWHGGSTPAAYRQRDILAMLNTLKMRPDYTGSVE